MKIVLQVKLLPSPDQAAALEATLYRCNESANHAARVAFERRTFGRNDLQKLVYGELKNIFGLGAQAAVRVVKKTVDAYATLHGNLKAGQLGPKGSPRRLKAENKPITFRTDAAQPFDDRVLSWQMDSRVVSIWTITGRVRAIPFSGNADQVKMLEQFRQGESDLVTRGGKWFLLATCEVPEEPLNSDPVDFIGVDRGIVNLATTSDGDNHSGRRLTRRRRHQCRKRDELQSKRTRSARRRAARRRKKEAQHASQVNHKIAKEIVAVAKRTGRGIALEELQGIRERVRPRRDQRTALSSWPFHQLGQYISYKARRAGVPVLEVDPRHTSQRCPVPWCGHTERANRPTRDTFCCRRCGFAGPADYVAAVNVRERARRAWGFVNSPASVPG